MAIWLRELGIIMVILIAGVAYCLLVLVAYRKYQNWWDSRQTVAKNPAYPLGKRSGEKRKHSMIKKVKDNLTNDKGQDSDKNLTPHQEILYHDIKPKGNGTLGRIFKNLTPLIRLS